MHDNKNQINEYIVKVIKNKLENRTKILIDEAKKKLDDMIPEIVAECIIDIVESENVQSMNRLIDFRITKR